MYVNAIFQASEQAAAQFLTERSFGLFAIHDGAQLHASHLPFLYRPDRGPLGAIEFHVAKGNPLHRIILDHPHCLLAVQGPDAYISPGWYSSPGQVPTWNYVAVHASGTARPLPPEATRAHVEALSDQFENRVAPDKPWTTAKMDPAKLEAMTKAIVAVEMVVENLQPQWKLSQHKGQADHVSVTTGLRTRSEPGASHAIADLMDAARPVQ